MKNAEVEVASKLLWVAFITCHVMHLFAHFVVTMPAS